MALQLKIALEEKSQSEQEMCEALKQLDKAIDIINERDNTIEVKDMFMGTLNSTIELKQDRIDALKKDNAALKAQLETITNEVLYLRSCAFQPDFDDDEVAAAAAAADAASGEGGDICEQQDSLPPIIYQTAAQQQLLAAKNKVDSLIPEGREGKDGVTQAMAKRLLDRAAMLQAQAQELGAATAPQLVGQVLAHDTKLLGASFSVAMALLAAAAAADASVAVTN